RIQLLFLFVIVLSFGFTIWEVARLYPNENVYFNQIIGGLSGAKEKNIPYWGYNYGNVYFQGVEWLNNNAISNAKLTLPIVKMVKIEFKSQKELIIHKFLLNG